MRGAAAVRALRTVRPEDRPVDGHACAVAVVADDALAKLPRAAGRLGVATLSGPALLRAACGLRQVEMPEGGRVDLLTVGPAAEEPVVAVPAEPASLARLAALITRRPEVRRRVCLVDPAALASALALIRRIEARRAPPPVTRTPSADMVERVLSLLSRRAGPLDARRTLDAEQARCAAIGAVALAAATAYVPEAVFAGTAAVASALFVGFAALRLAACGLAAAHRCEVPRRPLAEAELPTYTVLVPLLNEARIVPRLVAGLKALRYPAGRLDVKLLVEEHDRSTREALDRHAAGTAFEVVVVPLAGPRTKPKALDVGLPLARGDLVTIYDAEDRPEPDQLWKVAEVFAAAPASLGCVQARLAVDHAGDSWITRMFALEYAMLFDRLLPWLAAWRLPFLLGGTSNHFRGLR